MHVLAVADESTYKQNIPMGDHPIIWTNEKYDRMLYIGMYRFGKNSVPYMSSMFGHGSGGISNGITGKDGNGDGLRIDFKQEDNGNEWRWTEQWIPQSGWFLQAVTAMSKDK